MNTRVINFLFLLTICSLTGTSNAIELTLQQNPLYTIILSQISMITKEKGEAAGFEKVLSLLNELNKNNVKIIEANNNTLRNLTINCELSNSSMFTNLASLQNMLSNYTKSLDGLSSKVKINNRIVDIEKELKLVMFQKDKYMNDFNLTSSQFQNFLTLINQALKLINDCGYPKIKYLYDSSVSKTPASPTLFQLSVDDYTTCYRKYDDLLRTKVAPFDDSQPLYFKTAIYFYLNYSDYDCMNGDLTNGVNSTLELNKTLNKFIDYRKAKLDFYSNYTQQIFAYDATIKSFNSMIEDSKSNLKNLDEVQNSINKNINGTKLAIENLQKSITLLNTDCRNQAVSLNQKIQTW